MGGRVGSAVLQVGYELSRVGNDLSKSVWGRRIALVIITVYGPDFFLPMARRSRSAWPNE
jgi:hypothetical protein